MSQELLLEGRYVVLRPLAPDDAEITFRWRSGARARLLNKGADSVDAQRGWISSRPGDEYNFIIQLKTGRPVGMLSLTGVDAVNRHAEPGRFLIGEEDAVRGVPAAVEAMMLLYDFAFDTLGLVRVFGTIAAENRRMVKWQTYLGMREEGRMRRHYFIDGRFQDALVFGLLAEEYHEYAQPKMKALIGLAEAGRQQETRE
jgi:RimJ/RimL family protein N-acetyltransferase